MLHVCRFPLQTLPLVYEAARVYRYKRIKLIALAQPPSSCFGFPPYGFAGPIHDQQGSSGPSRPGPSSTAKEPLFLHPQYLKVSPQRPDRADPNPITPTRTVSIFGAAYPLILKSCECFSDSGFFDVSEFLSAYRFHLLNHMRQGLLITFCTGYTGNLKKLRRLVFIVLND